MWRIDKCISAKDNHRLIGNILNFIRLWRNRNWYNKTKLDMARLEFKGKAFVQNYHLQVKYHQLIPRKQKSLTDKVSLHDNLIIHGDNLKALKALLPTYAGKIKCIYIDPPYNTGNEKWAYNDNVNSPMMQ